MRWGGRDSFGHSGALQENDEAKQELLAEGAQDFYSASSRALVLHLDGKDIELKRVQ